MSLPKALELRTKSKNDLLTELNQYKTELGQLQVARVSQSGSAKLFRIRQVRKTIARILTIINQQKAINLKKFYKGKKFKPLSCRLKQTRAKRRALTFQQTHRVTTKQWKRHIHFPQRKFALKQDV
ncbi:hypothetical protein HZS_920 [Henneguya salminicola]|nr:hypothetical protein HZS_920 [Henneguya salminicola]